jgi:putative ABC transport system permease protein
MRNIIPREGGRFIDDLDMKERRRVIVLGNKVEELLFGVGNGVGKLVYVGDVPFLVIGVMQKETQNSSYNSRDQDRVFIPATTFSSVFGEVHLNNIIYQVKDPSIAEQTSDQIREVLSKKYRFDPLDKDAVWIWDTNEFDKFFFYFFLAFNIFMGLIGSFTLGVGGVGVANIMYIVVQERTREIGIKRAVGAKRSNILVQFFLETLFIIMIGSSAGFAISVALIKAMTLLPIKEFVGTPVLSIEVAGAAALILAIVGFTAGLMPARRAANLDPIECLR